MVLNATLNNISGISWRYGLILQMIDTFYISMVLHRKGTYLSLLACTMANGCKTYLLSPCLQGGNNWHGDKTGVFQYYDLR